MNINNDGLLVIGVWSVIGVWKRKFYLIEDSEIDNLSFLTELY